MRYFKLFRKQSGCYFRLFFTLVIVFISLLTVNTTLEKTLFASNKKTQKPPWIMIFNGKDLSGWQQKGGKALYSVENGVIIGSTVLNTPNSFLCTNSTYSDFILEIEFKVDPILNSGIQIRSNSFPEYRKGRVHGYQVEIDPSDRAWTAGIYDEARRGWLYNLKENKTAQKAFKQGQWNKLRIEAIGDFIRTWLNDVPASNLKDNMTQKGFIGLQVHGIGKDKTKQNIKVCWKDIRIITETPEKYTWKSPLSAKSMVNKLTDNEISWGYELLFNGETTKGWRGAKSDHFPKKGWKVKNGELIVLASHGGESSNGGDIITIDKYSNFELQVDFKLTEGANSGIKYFVLTELNKGPGSAIGLEYQLLDDNKHPDAKKGNHEGSRTLASLYDLIKAENKFPRPIGQWNHARIISSNNHIEHWLNGRKVLEYEIGSNEYRKLVSESKYKIWQNFGEASAGHILLQDHGNQVHFRNIKIKVLENK